MGLTIIPRSDKVVGTALDQCPFSVAVGTVVEAIERQWRRNAFGQVDLDINLGLAVVATIRVKIGAVIVERKRLIVGQVTAIGTRRGIMARVGHVHQVADAVLCRAVETQSMVDDANGVAVQLVVVGVRGAGRAGLRDVELGARLRARLSVGVYRGRHRNLGRDRARVGRPVRDDAKASIGVDGQVPVVEVGIAGSVLSVLSKGAEGDDKDDDTTGDTYETILRLNSFSSREATGLAETRVAVLARRADNELDHFMLSFFAVCAVGMSVRCVDVLFGETKML